MERSLFKYVWRHSKREQIAILMLVAISMPFYFISLDLPKAIVNKGIQGTGFDAPGSTLPFLRTNMPLGETLFGREVLLFEGFQLTQPGLLIALSFAFLMMVIINGAFKYRINTSKGRLGERMLRRLRYTLTDRLLRFPIFQIRRMKSAEVATMIKDEVEPLGGFIGDAFVTPLFLGGQAATAMLFIMVQSIWLGLVAAGIIVGQAIIIPRLRRRILILGKQRQLTARALAGRAAELVDGAIEVHANDTSNFERADIAERLGTIFGIRFEIFQRKFFVKFLNNFLSQLTPFLFYVVGGLLAIYGHLDIGALVAVIAAYKDLPGPIKELIDWDQQRQDVQIKYDQVIEQFQPIEILAPEAQAIAEKQPQALEGHVELSSVMLIDDSSKRLIDSVSAKIGLDQHVAIVGASGSGKEHLCLLLAGLARPTGGEVKLGGLKLESLPQGVTGQRLAYVGQDAYLFPLSVGDNLTYGLKHRPVGEAPPERREVWAETIAESRRAGNSTLDPRADWTDYAAAGVDGPEGLVSAMIEILRLVDLDEDVYRLGLYGHCDPDATPKLSGGVLEARRALNKRLAEADEEDLVVRFDPKAFNPQATVAENLLFGTPLKPEYRAEALAENRLIQEVLSSLGLLDRIEAMGADIAKTMIEIFADLPPGHPFFEQFSFIDAEDLPEYRGLVGRIEKSGLASLSETERRRITALAFRYIEARHRLGLIGEAEEKGFVEAREKIAEALAESDPKAVEAYDPEAYNRYASLQDNILFGRLAYGQAQAEERIGELLRGVLEECGVLEQVIEVGLTYQVGVGGKRLTAVQRQKLALARALLKRPDLLIVDAALAVLDGGSQQQLMERVLEACKGKGVIWNLERAAGARIFDRVLVLQGGRLVEQGEFGELNKSGTTFSTLVEAA